MAFAAPLLPLLTQAAPLLSIAGTAISAIGESRASNYQAAVMERQAERDAFTGQVQSQDAGIDAGLQIGQATAALAATGATLQSPAAQRRLAMMRILGRRDAGRIVADARVKSDNSLSDAGQARSAAKNALISGVFGIGSDLINSATMANKRKVDSLQASTRNTASGN